MTDKLKSRINRFVSNSNVDATTRNDWMGTQRKLRIVVEIDRSTLEFCVTQYHRTGWSVLERFDNEIDAQQYAAKVRQS
jgi:hypothetical protein